MGNYDHLPWDGDEELDIVHVKPGVSGPINPDGTAKPGSLAGRIPKNQWKLEKLAEWIITPYRKRKTRINLARELGIDPEAIEEWQKNPKMVKRLHQLAQAKAMRVIALQLDQIQKKAENGKAAQWEIELARKIAIGDERQGNVSISIDNRRSGYTESGIAFVNRFRERQKGGLLRRLQAMEPGELTEDLAHEAADQAGEAEVGVVEAGGPETAESSVMEVRDGAG